MRAWICQYEDWPEVTQVLLASSRSAARMKYAQKAEEAGYGEVRRHLPRIRVRRAVVRSRS